MRRSVVAAELAPFAVLPEHAVHHLDRDRTAAADRWSRRARSRACPRSATMASARRCGGESAAPCRSSRTTSRDSRWRWPGSRRGPSNRWVFGAAPMWLTQVSRDESAVEDRRPLHLGPGRLAEDGAGAVPASGQRGQQGTVGGAGGGWACGRRRDAGSGEQASMRAIGRMGPQAHMTDEPCPATDSAPAAVRPRLEWGQTPLQVPGATRRRPARTACPRAARGPGGSG